MKQTLKRDFRNNLDFSWIDSLGGVDLERNLARLEFLGEGRHFRVFKSLPPSDGRQSIILKVANQGYMETRTGAGIKRWIQALKNLEVGDCPYVPPMHFKYDTTFEQLFYFQPFGDDLHDPKLKEKIASEFCLALNGFGMKIDDHIQIKECRDIPFVVDYSDISFGDTRLNT